MLYARKISETPWFIRPLLDADAISELGTDNHDLSVWEVQDDLSNIDDIALALAMSRSKIEEMYIALLDINEVSRQYDWKMQFNKLDGNSYYSLINSAHTNFIVETFWQQGFLAEYIKHILSDCNKFKYYNVLDLENILYKSVKTGTLTKEEIKSRGGDWKKALSKMESTYGVIS